ncbi:NrsF family protein [Rhodoplanes azumiensis]|uniref:NrsF family protein n=1 Tax=Rhodoplanes azumiensis TaxID=1897628 RepID=A0ABW5APB8_9BRAD
MRRSRRGGARGAVRAGAEGEGGLGAVLHAGHGPDDAPLRVAAWYPLAIRAVTVAGWAAARVSVRW